MKIFVAGATGALGRRLVPLLVANGHTVVGTTRTPSKVAALRAVGATPVVLDALDRDAVIDALTRAEPEVVVHELTALAGFTDFRKLDEGFAATNRLRTEGTDHLLEAIRRLAGKDVSVRLVTGDNRLAARKLAAAVGLDADRLLTGIDIDRLDDQQLARRADGTAVFAEVEPLHKERIVRALRAAGQVVGFLGDGINDAAALAAADVGISVDTAVDVAKQSAAIVLLDKSLAVVADGVRLGRQTFANTLKYIRVTTSANFGNVLSMAAAAGFLPFLPLLPRQILLLNFLSDIPGTTIAADTADPEQASGPGPGTCGPSAPS